MQLHAVSDPIPPGNDGYAESVDDADHAVTTQNDQEDDEGLIPQKEKRTPRFINTYETVKH